MNHEDYGRGYSTALIEIVDMLNPCFKDFKQHAEQGNVDAMKQDMLHVYDEIKALYERNKTKED